MATGHVTVNIDAEISKPLWELIGELKCEVRELRRELADTRDELRNKTAAHYHYYPQQVAPSVTPMNPWLYPIVTYC